MIFFGSDQDNSYPKNSKANSKRYVTFCQNMTEASSGNIKASTHIGLYQKNTLSIWSSRLKDSMPGCIFVPSIKLSRQRVDGPNTKVKK